MALTADGGPPCDLLRMPYELLKRILTELTQCDQLSIAKTCVHLWEIAYPMAHDRIVVNVDPMVKESVWKNFASGVCLRYVRHLEIRASPNATGGKEKGTGDLVAGMLLAALRRHQLLSFGLVSPPSATSYVSMKNVVILLETQQRLQRVSLPLIGGSTGVQFMDYLAKSSILHHLREFALQLSTDTAFDHQLSGIVTKLPTLQLLHLRLSSLEGFTPSNPFGVRVGNLPNPKLGMFSLATSLTLRGVTFDVRAGLTPTPSFPALCALAVVDCHKASFFFMRLNPEMFPMLSALMINVKADASSGFVERFIRGLTSLRELIIHGGRAWMTNLTNLLPHTQSLELLSFHEPGNDNALAHLAITGGKAFLSSLTAIRHLGFFVGHVWLQELLGGIEYGIQPFLEQLKFLPMHGHLRTVGFHCKTTIDERPRSLTEDEKKGFEHGALEKLIGLAALERLHGENGFPNISPSLDYLSISSSYDFLYECVPTELRLLLAAENSRTRKRMFSLQPRVAFKPAEELKKEMMATYAGDGYYFFEDYVDNMMKPSYWRR